MTQIKALFHNRSQTAKMLNALLFLIVGYRQQPPAN
jgi:hypothetical protein